MFLDEAQRLEGQDTLDVLWGDKNPPFKAWSLFFLCHLLCDVCADGCSKVCLNVCLSTCVWKPETQCLWPVSILCMKAGY